MIILCWDESTREFVVDCDSCGHTERFPYGYAPSKVHTVMTARDRGNKGVAKISASRAYAKHYNEHARPGQAEAKRAMAKDYAKGYPVKRPRNAAD
jgi:hypothetical protein